MTQVLAPWQPETELPTALQIRALKNDVPFLLVGGSVASGKTSLALMQASQWTEHAHYRCLVLRKRFVDLSVPGNSLPRAKAWWPTFMRGAYTFRFPSGGTITFGHLTDSQAHLRYGSSEFHRIVIDEAGEVPQEQIEFMASRIRKSPGDPIPTSLRLLSNPIGPSREYLRDRFVRSDAPERYDYIDAPTDWTIVDREYMAWLDSLPPLLQRRLKHGDWDAEADTGFFEGLHKVERVTAYEAATSVRAWDLAATAGDGDYTVGVRMDWTTDPLYVVVDVVRGQWAPAQRNNIIRATAEADGPGTIIAIEEEGGSAGKDQVLLMRQLLQGFTVHVDKPTQAKARRAERLAVAIYGGQVRHAGGEWHRVWVNELRAFGGLYQRHDDQVDASALAVNTLDAYHRRIRPEIMRVG